MREGGRGEGGGEHLSLGAIMVCMRIQNSGWGMHHEQGQVDLHPLWLQVNM